MAEKKRFLIHVAETRHFEFEVHADSQSEAENIGQQIWRQAPTTGQWELSDTETDYHATEKSSSRDRTGEAYVVPASASHGPR